MRDYQLFRQDREKWTTVDVRGWHKDRLWLRNPGWQTIVELNRADLRANRCALDEDGHWYFTPDGKQREQTEIAEALATPIKAEEWLWQCWHRVEINGAPISCWSKVRVINRTERWIFVRNIWGKTSWFYSHLIECDGRSGDQDGHSFGEEWEKRRVEWEEKRRRDRAQQERAREGDWRSWAGASSASQRKADAATLGIAETATEAEIIAAYRRLAKAHHPDTGGSAEAFRLLTEARDRMLSRAGTAA